MQKKQLNDFIFSWKFSLSLMMILIKFAAPGIGYFVLVLINSFVNWKMMELFSVPVKNNT